MSDSPRWCATCNAHGDHHTPQLAAALVAQIGDTVRLTRTWLPVPEGTVGIVEGRVGSKHAEVRFDGYHDGIALCYPDAHLEVTRRSGVTTMSELEKPSADFKSEAASIASLPEYPVAELRGDLHHLLNPIIGHLRLIDHHAGNETWAHTIDRLRLAVALADVAAGEEPRDFDTRMGRARHGCGVYRNESPEVVAEIQAAWTAQQAKVSEVDRG